MTRSGKKKKKKKKKKENKVTKSRLLRLLRKLRAKALRLWKDKVKKNAGYKCELCWFFDHKVVTEFLQAHHIEDYKANVAFRFDPRAGISVCPRHHKFGRMAAHRSFLTVYVYMTQNRKEDFDYLVSNWKKEIPELVIDSEAAIEQLLTAKTFLEEIIGALI
jgi:hypothetical protein